MSTAGKGNRTRKTLSFFRVNFGHTPPFEVLCDGPTVFQSLKNDLYLKQSLPKLLGGPAYPVVTECIVNELRTLGDDYSNAALFAKRVKRIPCVHEGKASVAECLTTLLRKPSETKLLLASTDPDVIANVIRIPGIPILSILNQKKFVLKAPSPATLKFVKESEKQKTQSLSEPDKALVDRVKAAEQQGREKRFVGKKRKRAKGPNPLSVKKPKVNHKKSSGNQQRRSSLHSRSVVSPGGTPLVSNIPNDEADHLVSNGTWDQALQINSNEGRGEAKPERIRRESNDDVEIADLRTKSATKEVGEPEKRYISGSHVTQKALRKRRRKHATGKDDTAVATKATVEDLSGNIDPVPAGLLKEGCLTLKDRPDRVAGGSERRRAQDIPIATKEYTERTSNDNGAATDTDGHAKTRPQLPVRQGPALNAEEHDSIVYKVTENLQMTKRNLDVSQDHNEHGSNATVTGLKNVVYDADNVQLTAMVQTRVPAEGDTETTSAEREGKKTKKQRKNRRRRPKKTSV